MAEKTAKKTTKVEEKSSIEENASRTYSEAETQAMIQKAVEEALKKQSNGTILQVVPEEKVTLLFIGGISNGTTVNLGTIGKINKDGGTIEVPKRDFIQGMNPTVDLLLKNRKLIVVNGLNEEERERYELIYGEDEVLSANAFRKLLSYDTKTICDIFEKLCVEHKRIVVRVFLNAYMNNRDQRVSSEKVKALNKISKSVEERGMFIYLLELMGREYDD